jgi:tetratricopeptide (TPR) repeat protein
MLLISKSCKALPLLALLLSFAVTADCKAQPQTCNPKRTGADQALGSYESGYASYRRGDFAKAEDSFIEALRLEPNLLTAHYWLGKLYRETGRLEDAIFHWQEAERLVQLIKDRRAALAIENNEYPSYSQILRTTAAAKEAREAFERGLHLLDKGHWDGAEVEIRQAVELYPGNHQYILQLARILWDKGEKQASVKFYRDLLSKRDVSFASFREGINRMFAAEMDYVAAPLVMEKQDRFASEPEFAQIMQKFRREIEGNIVAAGKILQKMDGQVIINIGMANGLNLSDEYNLAFKAFQPGKPIIDPETGKTAGYAPEKTSADLLLTKVYQHTSWALVRKEFGNGVKAGDLIEFKKTVR